MIARIKRIFNSNADDGQASDKPGEEIRQFTFMVTKDEVGKSVTVKAINHIEAEKELAKEYPDYKIQFLWEWK